ACFVVGSFSLGCLPRSFSECVPTQAQSCPPDTGGNPQTCVNIGDGTVGACVPSCNPLDNTGCTDAGAPACHASDQTGEGLCTQLGAGGGANALCGAFYSDCQGGYGCLNGRCWRYCKDDGATVPQQCGIVGATCKALNPGVDPKVVGICSRSL